MPADGLGFFWFIKSHLIFHYTDLKYQLITKSRNPQKQLLKKQASKTNENMQVEIIACTSCSSFHKKQKWKAKRKKMFTQLKSPVNKTYAY